MEGEGGIIIHFLLLIFLCSQFCVLLLFIGSFSFLLFPILFPLAITFHILVSPGWSLIKSCAVAFFFLLLFIYLPSLFVFAGSWIVHSFSGGVSSDRRKSWNVLLRQRSEVAKVETRQGHTHTVIRLRYPVVFVYGASRGPCLICTYMECLGFCAQVW